MQNLNEVENMGLGGAAAFVEAIALQPTIYWKNAAQQGLAFTLNPKLLYRGIGAALVCRLSVVASPRFRTGCGVWIASACVWCGMGEGVGVGVGVDNTGYGMDVRVMYACGVSCCQLSVGCPRQ
jgi:hypothetical protein